MADLEEILEFIWEDADAADISTMFTALKERREFLARRAKIQFGVGQTVFFEDNDGKTHEGTVTKVNRKNVAVHDNEYNINWTVDPLILRSELVKI